MIAAAPPRRAVYQLTLIGLRRHRSKSVLIRHCVWSGRRISNIFLSRIFLLANPKQKNAGQENIRQCFAHLRMRYREFQVAAPLSNYVECLWALEGDERHESTSPERILPDGCVEMILNFGALFREHKESGRSELQPSRFVVGQMTQPVLVAPTGPVRLLGIRFAPGGALPFITIPPAELTNNIAPLEDIATSLDREITGRVYEARGLPEKISAIEALLLRRMSAKEERGASLQSAISGIVSSGGQISVDQLAGDLGISGRQLERRFISEVGIGPKLLCRILRFQQVFRAVEREDKNWARIAADCGYYDQAHLIRDFRQFAGQTPSVLFEHFTPFAEFFTRKQRASDFYNTPR
jgi:AraC-like DNA-binding protein